VTWPAEELEGGPGAATIASLHALAAGLCADRGLRVAVGRAWAYEPRTHTIVVPREGLATLGPVACAGIVAHEVGHAWLSRYADFELRASCRALGLLAMNALEDGRVERWMGARYPGVERWLAVAHADDGWQPSTPVWDFLQLVVREAATGFVPARADGAHTLVGLALGATREARRAYVEQFLPDERLTPPVEAFERYDEEVAPRDHGEDPQTDEEAWVRVCAFRALVHAEATLWPWVERLLEDEVRTLALALEDDRLRQDARAYSGFGPWSLRRAYDQRGARAAPPGSPHEPEARRLVQAIYTRIALSCARGRGGIRGTVAGLGGAGEPEVRSYRRLLDETSKLRAALRAAIAPALPPAERAPARRASTHGRRLSLRHAFAADAQRHRATAVFEHAGTPRRPRAAFSLLIDLSGSMHDRKIESAIRALSAVAEVLDELEVPFAVHGFQDELIPVLPHGRRLDDQARAALMDLAGEVDGCRPGGHNEPSYNDDGPCVLEAAERLAAVDAEDRWLLVLSDGHPEGRRSRRADLHAAVRTIGAMRPAVHVIGLGVGPGTKHVAEYYPRHLSEIPLAELPGKLGAVVRGCVGG
jgi:hypothetical protein